MFLGSGVALVVLVGCSGKSATAPEPDSADADTDADTDSDTDVDTDTDSDSDTEVVYSGDTAGSIEPGALIILSYTLDCGGGEATFEAETSVDQGSTRPPETSRRSSRATTTSRSRVG